MLATCTSRAAPLPPQACARPLRRQQAGILHLSQSAFLRAARVRRPLPLAPAATAQAQEQKEASGVCHVRVEQMGGTQSGCLPREHHASQCLLPASSCCAEPLLPAWHAQEFSDCPNFPCPCRPTRPLPPPLAATTTTTCPPQTTWSSWALCAPPPRAPRRAASRTHQLTTWWPLCSRTCSAGQQSSRRFAGGRGISFHVKLSEGWLFAEKDGTHGRAGVGLGLASGWAAAAAACFWCTEVGRRWEACALAAL